MIDRNARNEASSLLRQLMSGRIEVWDFLEWAEDLQTEDRAVQEVAAYGSGFDDDLGPDRLGRHNVSKSQRREAARMILFLRSDREYEWPPFPRCGPWDTMTGFLSMLGVFFGGFGLLCGMLNAFVFSLLGKSITTLAWLSRESKRRTLAWESSGDYFVWPYLRTEDLDEDKTLPR